MKNPKNNHKKTGGEVFPRRFRLCRILCAHLGSNQGPKDYESSVLLFFIAVCQVVMAKTLYIAKLLLNKVADTIISYSNIRKIPEISQHLYTFK